MIACSLKSCDIPDAWTLSLKSTYIWASQVCFHSDTPEPSRVQIARACRARLRAVWWTFDKKWARNDPGKLKTFPEWENVNLKKKMGLGSFHKGLKVVCPFFIKKKTLRGHRYVWLTYVQKRILIFFFEKSCAIPKKHCTCWPKQSAFANAVSGVGNPRRMHFVEFYTKRSVLGSKICSFLVILMTISSEQIDFHLILVVAKFICILFTPCENFITP